MWSRVERAGSRPLQTPSLKVPLQLSPDNIPFSDGVGRSLRIRASASGIGNREFQRLGELPLKSDLPFPDDIERCIGPMLFSAAVFLIPYIGYKGGPIVDIPSIHPLDVASLDGAFLDGCLGRIQLRSMTPVPLGLETEGLREQHEMHADALVEDIAVIYERGSPW